MTHKDLQTALDEAFCTQSEKLRRRGNTRVRIREQVMGQVVQLSEAQREEDIVHYLSQSKVKGSQKLKRDLKRVVMNDIYEKEKKRLFAFENGLLIFLRKGLATSFALVLLISLAVGPLQSINRINLVQNVRAAYVVCNGVVEINGELCVNESTKKVGNGDEIVTQSNSTATVYHTNFARTYFSEQTKASLVDSSPVSSRLNIIVNNGRIWHYSPSESSVVKTGSVTAEINGGALSLEAAEGNRGTTELFATVPYEVQIADRKHNATRLTLLNTEKVSIHNRSRNFRRSELVKSDFNNDAFAIQNVQDDVDFLADVRQAITKDKEVAAGTLPGDLGDSLGKMAQNAKIVLTPNQENKTELQLSLLEELFSEAIVLAEKGDEAMALESFQSYRKSFASLVRQNFDKLSQDESEKNARELALFNAHQEIVSLYEPGDAAYFIRDSFVEVALELEPYMLGRSPQQIGQDIASKELLRAHKTIEKGNEELTAQHLQKYEKILDKAALASTSQSEAEYVETDDLVILKDIAKRSQRLKPLVNEIAQKKVTQIKDLASDKLPQTVTTGTVVGTAYKEPETDRSTTKIVGLAVKEEESALSL